MAYVKSKSRPISG